MKKKVWIHFFKAPRRVTSISRRMQSAKLKRQLIRVKFALAQEKHETKEMLHIYKRYTLRQATADEMKVANRQFVDVLKGLGIGIFAVLPFAPLTIPIVIKMGKWVGVDILPSSFNEEFDKKHSKAVLHTMKNTTVSSGKPSPDQPHIE